MEKPETNGIFALDRDPFHGSRPTLQNEDKMENLKRLVKPPNSQIAQKKPNWNAFPILILTAILLPVLPSPNSPRFVQ